MKNESFKARGGKYIRLGSMLLMLIFTVCAFTLMWTAVSAFRKIRSGYANASECLAAARFTANHLRCAKGSVSVCCFSDGTLDKIIINGGNGYEDVITYRNGSLYEAFVHEGMTNSLGDELFPVSRLSVEENMSTSTVRITAESGQGQISTIYVKPSAKTEFYPSDRE